MFQGIFKSAINDANKNYIFGTGSIPINIKTAQLVTFADGTTKQQGYQVAEVNKLISTMLTGWDKDGNKPKSMSDNYLELILSCDNGFVVKKRLQFPHIIAWKDDSTPYNIADVYKEFSVDNWLKADDFENPDITLVVEPTDEILTTSTATPPEATTTNSGRFYLYYRNLPVGVNRIHIDFHIKTKTEPIDFDLEVIDGLSWKDAQVILASNDQAKINVLLSGIKDVYKFTGAEGDFEDITMHEWSALYQQIISLNPNNRFTHDLYFYIYDESELNTKLTELEQKVEPQYVDIASFSISGSVSKLGIFNPIDLAKRTDFIRVKEGIKIKAYDGATSYPQYAAVAFYNANFEFISTMEFSTDGLKEIVLTNSNIPSNAEYFIASTLNNFLSNSYVKFTDNNLSIISDAIVNMELNGVKDDSFSLFTKHYFIYNNSLYENEKLYISTDFLSVDGISDVFFWQLSASKGGKVVAFFDENKEFMSDYGADGITNSTIFSGKVEVPAGAKWVMFITEKNKLNSTIRISFNSIRGINLMISDLSSTVRQNKLSIASLSSSVELLERDVQNITTEYSNALKGVNFGTTEGDILFKNALKKVWIQILDPSFNATTLKLVHLCNKSNEQYNPWLAFYDQNNNYAISWYGNSLPLQTGVQHLTIRGFSTYYNLFYLHLIIDWDEIQEKKFTTGLQTTMDVSELNKVDTDTRTLAEQLTYASNDWKDNTIVCFGDSITEFKDSFNMGYTDYLKQFTGANIISIGIGGTQFRQRTIPVSSPSSNYVAYASLDIINIVKACCEQDFTNQIAANDWLKDKGDDNTTIINRMIAIDWSKVNAVTFFAGTNDWNNAAGQWGESGSSDINTTLGAINEIIRLILTTYPHIKIYWFTPIVRWLDERIPENFSDNLVRGTKTLKEFSAMIQTEVVRHHIPICDMYNTLGWNMYNFSNYFTDTDGTHPDKGYMTIARKFKGFIDANRTF